MVNKSWDIKIFENFKKAVYLICSWYLLYVIMYMKIKVGIKHIN